MLRECPDCHATNKVDESQYAPGSIATIYCWKCGCEFEVPISGDAASAPAASPTAVAATKVAAPAATSTVSTTDAELEKAKLLLEAERIKLEHRKLDNLEKSATPPIYAQPAQTTNYNGKPLKSKTTAGILALLLGGFGVHKFYLGKSGMGILYLVFCWTYIPGLIALFEGISYLTKSDEDFHANCY
ncbi:MAG: NINE protein [Muribaculaceae bacterium]|nr:NINE protein [Muribaculaceae bacterium]